MSEWVASSSLPWRRSGWRWLWLTALIIVIDQASKLWAVASLQLYQSIEVLPFFNLTLVHNPGAAFSFLSDASGWQRWFFVVLASVISVVILVWMRRLAASERRPAVALALILGGAVGNVLDRFQHGYVIDFIDVYYRDWHWPAFNVADSAITVGAALMILDALVGARKSGV